MSRYVKTVIVMPGPQTKKTDDPVQSSGSMWFHCPSFLDGFSMLLSLSLSRYVPRLLIDLRVCLNIGIYIPKIATQIGKLIIHHH